MSTDTNQNPTGQVEKKPRKWFRFCGCGCLVFVLFCGGGIGFAWNPLANFNQIKNQAKTAADENQAVIHLLGVPVEIGFWPIQNTSDDQDDSLRFPISGPNGSGVVIVAIEGDSIFSDVEIMSMNVEIEGEDTIDLMDDGLGLDIDEPEF